MKIRLNIDDELLAESMELSGISNKTKIIEIALLDLVRKLKRSKIKAACGRLNLNLDILKSRERKLQGRM